MKHEAYSVGFCLERLARAQRLGVRDIQEAMMMGLLDRAIDDALRELRETIDGGPPRLQVVKR